MNLFIARVIYGDKQISTKDWAQVLKFAKELGVDKKVLVLRYGLYAGTYKEKDLEDRGYALVNKKTGTEVGWLSNASLLVRNDLKGVEVLD